MPEPQSPSDRYRLSSLIRMDTVPRLAAIGAVIALLSGGFAYVGGWLSPHRLTPGRMIDGFEQVGGVHPGFRRNHAKGVCVAGWFDSSGQGAALSKAVVFRPGRSPVVGRFSLAGPVPALADSPKAVRSLALSFRPPGGGEWRTGMVDLPVFPVGDPQAFYDQLLAGRPDPATGKPDPTRMKAFLATHPGAALALQRIVAKPVSSGFADTRYNGLNAFRFVSAAGVSTPVRWSMVAVQPSAPPPPALAQARDKTYLFDALIDRLRQAPLQWRLMATIGQPGDPTHDASLPWPGDRRQIDLGVLTIDHIETEAPGNCRDINFDPLVLPDGIAPSDDPLLSTRSAAYSQSFTRRAGETKPPSPVQVGAAPAQTGKGA